MISGRSEQISAFVVFVVVTMLILFTKRTHSYFIRRNLFPRLVNNLKNIVSSNIAAKRPYSLETIKREKMSEALKRVWNVAGVKSEISRLQMRAEKKLEKLNERISKSESEEHKGNNAPLEEMNFISNRLQILHEVEDKLKCILSGTDKEFVELIPTLVELDISDSPPIRLDKVGTKKTKAPQPPPRKPYFTYHSIDGIEILVGRSAKDNDDLSCNPSLREDDDWWLHVVGYPGSHVVIRCVDDDLPEKFPQTIMDAAALAAANSKFEPKNRVEVSLTRVRHVKKPAGAKPGLVTIVGRISNIRLVKVNLGNEKGRMERLQRVG